MQTRTVTLPASTTTSLDGRRIIEIPETEHTYAPTLAKVHKWLYSDNGPFVLNWPDGALCPFNPQVGIKNMTCCKGNRGIHRCPGIGLTNDDWVGCYAWSHHISHTYWSLDINAIIEQFPDDETIVATHLMDTIFRLSGWYDWLREKHIRKESKTGYRQPMIAFPYRQ